QFARSVELNGAVVLLASLFVLPATAPLLLTQTVAACRRSLGLLTDPGIVSRDGIWTLAQQIAVPAARAVLPIGFACMAAGVIANVVQVGFKPSTHGLKPDFKRLNPVSGAKNLFGKRAAVETGKSLTKVGVVGAVVALAVLPKL